MGNTGVISHGRAIPSNRGGLSRALLRCRMNSGWCEFSEKILIHREVTSARRGVLAPVAVEGEIGLRLVCEIRAAGSAQIVRILVSTFCSLPTSISHIFAATGYVSSSTDDDQGEERRRRCFVGLVSSQLLFDQPDNIKLHVGAARQHPT